jgi:hypothetical protein
VLQSGHANKTLFFLNPSLNAGTRSPQLMENFGFSAADLQFVEVDRILRATSPERLIFILARPERQAYLVAARLAFEDMHEQLVPYLSRHFFFGRYFRKEKSQRMPSPKR